MPPWGVFIAAMIQVARNPQQLLRHSYCVVALKRMISALEKSPSKS
jgi:hypothetical protein